MNKIVILTDGKAGHENQSRAFARALGGEADVFEIHFKSKFHKALSYLLDHLSIRTLSLFTPDPSSLLPAPYSLVLGTGSGTFYAVKAFARAHHIPGGVILYPRGYHLPSFDCILAPSFDRPKKAPNVIEIPANLVANDAAFYEKGVAAFRERYTGATDNAIAVIVGGPNKCSTMSPDWMKRELDAIFSNETSHSSHSSQSSHYWVTTSRRTPPEVEAVIDSYPWDYKLLYSKDHFNPIPAFVKLARRLYVTAESTGMLSEACTFGTAEVHALDNLNPGPHKFRRFVENLRTAGYIDGSRKIDLAEPFAQARRIFGTI